MITLINPPQPVLEVVHLNCNSTSPGGKDYVMVLLQNGDVWSCNGPAFTVRNGGGAVRTLSARWDDVLDQKRNKGYRIIGEYQSGRWRSRIGETYKDLPNIPVTAAASPSSDPPPQPKVAPKPQSKSDLTKQYPVSKMAENWGSDAPEEWFAVF